MIDNNASADLMSADSPSLEYHLRETEQLLEITLLKKKLRETERAMEQIMADMAEHKNGTNATAEAGRAAMTTKTTQVRSHCSLTNKRKQLLHEINEWINHIPTKQSNAIFRMEITSVFFWSNIY